VSFQEVFLVRCCLQCAFLQLTTSLQHVAFSSTRSSPVDVVLHCISNVLHWFLENEMLLNPNKMEAVVFKIHARLDDAVQLLDVTLDEDLSLDRRFTDIVHGCS